MAKSPDIGLEQLQTAVSYLAWVFEEGSLVAHYDKVLRQEIALTLNILLDKVNGLPDEIPRHLVQAAAVRAIVSASEKMKVGDVDTSHVDLEQNMRQAELKMGVQGHILSEWQPTSAADGEMEYEATCKYCGGVVYANQSSFYTFMTDECGGSLPSADLHIDEETIVALWDISQHE